MGSHEFDYGPKGLEPLLNDPRTQILCANMIKDAGVDTILKENVHPHVVLSRGGLSIGIIGYITPEAVYLARTGRRINEHFAIYIICILYCAYWS